MTHMHNDFECLSPRYYVDTKSRLAYEQNPYSKHGVRSKTLDRHVLKSVVRQITNLHSDKRDQSGYD
jgi:hypothetical protein